MPLYWALFENPEPDRRLSRYPPRSGKTNHGERIPSPRPEKKKTLRTRLNVPKVSLDLGLTTLAYKGFCHDFQTSNRHNQAQLH